MADLRSAAADHVTRARRSPTLYDFRVCRGGTLHLCKYNFKKVTSSRTGLPTCVGMADFSPDKGFILNPGPGVWTVPAVVSVPDSYRGLTGVLPVQVSHA